MTEPELQFSAVTGAGEGSRPSGRKRLIVSAIALVVTGSGLAAALFLGTLGYDVRRANMHERRLKGILVQTPTVYQVTEGLKEKAPLALVVESETDLERAILDWGDDKRDDVRRKAASWPQVRVFDAGDMMYFIYFDDENIMRDFLYVTSKGEP